MAKKILLSAAIGILAFFFVVNVLAQDRDYSKERIERKRTKDIGGIRE